MAAAHKENNNHGQMEYEKPKRKWQTRNSIEKRNNNWIPAIYFPKGFKFQLLLPCTGFKFYHSFILLVSKVYISNSPFIYYASEDCIIISIKIL